MVINLFRGSFYEFAEVHIALDKCATSLLTSEGNMRIVCPEMFVLYIESKKMSSIPRTCES